MALAQIEKKYQALLKRTASIREKAKQPITTGLMTAGTMGSGFGFGWLAGRYGEPELAGVPLYLAGGGIGLVGGMFLGTGPGARGMAGKAVVSVSTGALTAFSTQAGYMSGLEGAVEEVGGEATLGSVIDNREAGKNDDGSAIEED